MNILKQTVLLALLLGLGFTVRGQPLAGTWSLGPQRFSPREKHGVHCFGNGSLLLFGGRADDGRQFDLWSGERDSNSQAWTWTQKYLGGAITPRETTTVHPIEEDVFLFGGRTDSTNGIDELWHLEGSNWEEITKDPSSWPSPRYRHQGITIPSMNGFLILFGTSTQQLYNDVWFYNATEGKFVVLHKGGTASGTVPEKRFDPCCVYRQNTSSVVCFGGTMPLDDSNDIWEFDLTSNTWTLHTPATTSPASDLPKGRRLAMCSLVNGNAIAVWSGYSSNDSDNVAGDIVYVFDLGTKIWSATAQAVGSQPITRDGSYLCPTPDSVHTDSIFLVGGLGIDRSKRNDIWILNSTNFLFQLSEETLALPSPRSEHNAVVVGSQMIILFGRGSASTPFEDVWSFETTTATWTRLASSCPFGGRSGAAAVARGNSILVYGGVTTDETITKQLLTFDIVTMTWREIEASGSPEGRYRHSAALLSDGALLVSGGTTTSSATTSDFYLYDTAASAWLGPMTKTGTTTMPARRSHALVQNPVNGDLTILGGKSTAVLMDRWKVTVTNYTHVHLEELTSTIADAGVTQRQYIRSEAAVIGSGRHYLICGGAISGDFPVPEESNCYQYNSVSGQNAQVEGSPVTAYFTSAVFVQRTMYIFGGNLIQSAIKRTHTFLNVLQKFEFDANCENLLEATADASCIHCAAGSIGTNNCSLVPAGQYRSPYSATAELCAAGRSSSFAGAQSPLFCIPCADGTFSSTPGQSSCVSCSAGKRCPVGSQLEADASRLINSTNYEEQPEAFLAEGVPVRYLILIGAVWGGVLLFVGVFAFCEERRWNRAVKYYVNEPDEQVLEDIFSFHVPDETGAGSGRGLTGIDLQNALNDSARHFYQMADEEIEKVITDEVADELMDFFDASGTQHLSLDQFKVVICMLFEKGKFPPLPETEFMASGEVRPIRQPLLSLEELDLFSTQHRFWKIGEPVATQKTRSGGALSLIGLTATIAIAVMLILLFVLDNTEETQATLPKVAVRKEITADLTLEVRTLGENQEALCVESGTVDQCAGANSGVTVESSSIALSAISPPPQTTCSFAAPGYCRMKWTCAACKLTNLTNKLTFLFGHPDWYSTETVVTLSSDSAVWKDFGPYSGGEKAQSTVSRVFQPAQSTEVMKGYPATTLNIFTVPATWVSPRSVMDLRRLEGTGYQLTHQASSIGKQSPVTELPTHIGVPIEIVFEVSDTFLVIERFLKKDAVSVTATILGVFSGVLAVTALAVGAWDVFFRWNRKKEKKSDAGKENLELGQQSIVPGPSQGGGSVLMSSGGMESTSSVNGAMAHSNFHATASSVFGEPDEAITMKDRRRKKFVNSHADVLVSDCNFRRPHARALIETVVNIAESFQSAEEASLGQGDGGVPTNADALANSSNRLHPRMIRGRFNAKKAWGTLLGGLATRTASRPSSRGRLGSAMGAPARQQQDNQHALVQALEDFTPKDSALSTVGKSPIIQPHTNPLAAAGCEDVNNSSVSSAEQQQRQSHDSSVGSSSAGPRLMKILSPVHVGEVNHK